MINTNRCGKSRSYYEVVMIWQAISIQRGPVQKMKDIITKITQMIYETGRKKDNCKENLTHHFAFPVRSWTDIS